MTNKAYFKNTNFIFQCLFNILGWVGISSTLITFNSTNTFNYNLDLPPLIPSIFIYTIYRLNYIAKLIYLGVLMFGGFPEVSLEFLDYITVGFWFLVTGLIFISEGFWFRRYPFFEIITAGWKIQNEIYSRLRQKDEFLRKLQISAVKKAIFQITIMGIGITAMGIQYSAAPKYPIFTGYMVTEDSTRMTVLFGIHEIGFLVTAWFFYGSVICLSSLLGRQISLTLEYLTDELQIVLDSLELNGRFEIKNHRMDHDDFLDSYGGGRGNGSGHSSSRSRRLQNLHNKKSLDLIGGFSPYTLDILIMDYSKMSMYLERLNEFCAYKFLFIHITAYIQMIGDVFIMIQILRSGGEFMDVFFYLEDCGVCMFMLFKCFKSMSLVEPASEAFLRTFKILLSNNKLPNRKFYRKEFLTMRVFALKIGPNFMSPESVGNAIMVLLNYYIMAALW